VKHPASHILRQLLIDATILEVTEGSPVKDWACYLGFLPDGAPAPDNAACSYDTPGLLDGRLMKTGENIIHHGVQIKVRSKTYISGWRKIYDVAQKFETVKHATVVLEGTSYNVQAVSQVGSILSLGVDEGTKRRDLFTLNVAVSLSLNP
jgi:hypothetical protein